MDEEHKIIIIEDDSEDTEVLLEILEELGLKNNIKAFYNCDAALKYFTETDDKILLILSDITFSHMNGIDLKKKIETDPELKRKTIPFIFYTSEGRETQINEAFVEANVHGYFHKVSDYNIMKQDIKLIIDYWSRSQRPY